MYGFEHTPDTVLIDAECSNGRDALDPADVWTCEWYGEAEATLSDPFTAVWRCSACGHDNVVDLPDPFES